MIKDILETIWLEILLRYSKFRLWRAKRRLAKATRKLAEVKEKYNVKIQ